MPKPVPIEQVKRKGALPAVIDLTLVCIDVDTQMGYKAHRWEEESSVITLEADGQPVGSYRICTRCLVTDPPGAY